MRDKRSSAVGFSRVLGPSQAIALGLTLSLGACVFGLLTILLPIGAGRTPQVYLLAGVLFLPLILTYAERASVSDRSHGAYLAARSTGGLHTVFTVGWLKVGGYLSLAAALALAITDRLGLLLAEFTPDPPSPWIVVTGVVLLAAVNELSGASERWRSRSFLVWGAVLTFWVLVTMALYEIQPGTSKARISAPADHWLTLVAVLAAGLWSVDLVLSNRGRLREPQRNTPWVLTIVWLATMIMGAIVAWLAWLYPELLASNFVPDVSWDENQIQLLGLGVGLGLGWAALSRTLSGAMRLARAMINDGLLPGGALPTLPGWPGVGLLVLCAIVVTAAGLATAGRLLGFAALTFLWTTTLIMFPWARVSREKVTPRFRLPLHPLFPALSAAGAIFFSLILPFSTIRAGVAWLILGVIYFLAWGRRHGTVKRREEVVVGDLSSAPPKTGARILVAAGDGQLSSSLIRLGAAMAGSRDGELLVLETVSITEQTPTDEARRTADDAWVELAERIDGIVSAELQVTPLVRIAGDAATAILETSREYQVDLIYLGWPVDKDLYGSEGTVNERVFAATSTSMMILRGELPDPLRSVVVSTAGGPHAAAALTVGRGLVGKEGSLTLISVGVGAKGREKAEAALAATLEKVPDIGPVETRALEADDVVSGIQQEAERHDLLLMGAAIDRLLGQTVIGGVHQAFIEGSSVASGMIKRSEKVRRFWLRRLWEAVSRPLPTLSARERAEVFAGMRHSARADVDYYVLISLASAIATAGLVLNSGAVIIGAMLVAPLMSPILAMAHGIVQGSALLLRRGGISTFKGVSVAIGIGTLAGTLLPQSPPTSEILARSEPNLLDLTVAVAAGAAAAYGVCRKSVAAALPGVAISVALVPPLCVVGWGIGQSRFDIAAGAMVLFMTNLAAIVLVGALVFLMMGFRPIRIERGVEVRRAFSLAGLVIVGLLVPLGLSTVRSFQAGRIEFRVHRMLEEIDEDNPGEIRDLSVRREGGEFVVHAVIHHYGEPNIPGVHLFRRQLEEHVGIPVRVRVTFLTGVLVESGGDDEPAPEDEDYESPWLEP